MNVQFEAYTQELLIGQKCSPFDSYSEKLYGQPKHFLSIRNDQARIRLEQAEQFRSLWVSLRSTDEYKRKSGVFGIEFLIPPSCDGIVIGATRLGSPKQNVILDNPIEIFEEEGQVIDKLIEGVDINNKSDLEMSLFFMDMIHLKSGQQGPSKNLKGGEPVDKVFNSISNGDKVQCGQVADILSRCLHKAGIGHRTLSLYRYYPKLKGVVVNGHNVIEIFSRELNKWVMIDPSYNIYILYDVVPLSCFEIREKIKAKNPNMEIINNGATFVKNYTAQINYPVRHEGDYDYFCHFNVISLRTMRPESFSPKSILSLLAKKPSKYEYAIYPRTASLGDFL